MPLHNNLLSREFSNDSLKRFKRFIQTVNSFDSFKWFVQTIYWSVDQFTYWSINSIDWLINLFAIDQLFEQWTCSPAYDEFIICQFENQYSSGQENWKLKVNTSKNNIGIFLLLLTFWLSLPSSSGNVRCSSWWDVVVERDHSVDIDPEWDV